MSVPASLSLLSHVVPAGSLAPGIFSSLFLLHLPSLLSQYEKHTPRSTQQVPCAALSPRPLLSPMALSAQRAHERSGRHPPDITPAGRALRGLVASCATSAPPARYDGIHPSLGPPRARESGRAASFPGAEGRGVSRCSRGTRKWGVSSGECFARRHSKYRGPDVPKPVTKWTNSWSVQAAGPGSGPWGARAEVTWPHLTCQDDHFSKDRQLSRLILALWAVPHTPAGKRTPSLGGGCPVLSGLPPISAAAPGEGMPVTAAEGGRWEDNRGMGIGARSSAVAHPGKVGQRLAITLP